MWSVRGTAQRRGDPTLQSGGSGVRIPADPPEAWTGDLTSLALSFPVYEVKVMIVACLIGM